MITDTNVLIGHNQNLYYLAQHKRAFDIGYIYPLDIFESFVEQQSDWGIECSCKIEQDILYPNRFNLFPGKVSSLEVNLVLDFFRQVEARVGVKFDYQIIQQFLGHNFDFSKVTNIVTGVDFRKDFSASRLKFWFWIDGYPEKLETAISLLGDREDLRLLYTNQQWLVGFDFYLNGKSTIELYPQITQEQLGQREIQLRLAKVLSPQTLQFLDVFSGVLIGFTQNNPDRLIYGYLLNPSKFIDNLHNDLANRVHSYYRGQPVFNTMVCLSEKELLTGSIDKFNLYYQMSNASSY